jgi:alkylation response protein AidB-like acyl-CoA dehydrogenase
MDLALTPEQEAIRDNFARFCNEQIKPAAEAMDEAEEFPRELFEKVGALGFFEMRYPEEDGGADAGILACCLAIEELCRGSLSLGAACQMQGLMGTYFLQRFGSPELKERLLAPALTGEKIGTICMTEPGAGSDLFGMRTRAEEKDGGWLLNGQKMWITSAPVADFFTVFAKVGDPEGKDIGAFLVERDNPGLQVGRSIRKMGVRASITSEVALDDCRVEASHVLGEPGKALGYLRAILDEIRIVTAAMAVGGARGALEESLAYAKQRVQFGRPISKYQAIRFKFAEMATELEVARRMTYHAAALSEADLPRTKEAAMAKMFASEAAFRVCDQAARIMAAYGYAMEYPIQRYLRDIRFTLIGGGTSEMMKMIIARELGT